jgi:anti-sigma-K factor RskA
VSPTSHPVDELAVYALDALEYDERAAVEAHLAGCASCRAEVDAYRATLARLVVDEPPPPAVWQRIAYEVGATSIPTPLPTMPSGTAPPGAPPGPPGTGRPGPGPAAGAPPSHMRRGGPPARRWGLAVAGIAAAAALVVGGIAITRDDEGPTDLAALAEQAAEADGAQIATLSTEAGAPAARVVADGSTGFVLVDDLPMLPEGQEYQLWKLAGDVPVSLGMIGDGTTEATAFGLPADTTTFALSTEPAAGSPAPTGAIVATGQFS